jgi:VWFA-related protein
VVSFFEAVKAGTFDEEAQLAAARGRARADRAGLSLPLDRGRIFILFLDDLHVAPGDLQRTRDALLRFVEEEMGQNDEAAVVSASGQVGFLQQLTDNKVVLRAAAARINPRPLNVRDGQTPVMTESHAVSIERRDPSVISFFVDALMRENPAMRREMAESMVEQRARNMLTYSRSVSVNTLASLQATIRAAGPVPGRKILFFISDGFVADDRGGELRDWMRRVTDAAARSGVVIYSLDAEGLRTNMADASDDRGFDPSGRLVQADMSEGSLMQSPLFTLAADTGGRSSTRTRSATPSRARSRRLRSTTFWLGGPRRRARAGRRSTAAWRWPCASGPTCASSSARASSTLRPKSPRATRRRRRRRARRTPRPSPRPPPPPVRLAGRSYMRSASRVRNRTATMRAGRTSGSVIRKNACTALAPSILAAS